MRHLNAVNLKCGDSTYGYKHIRAEHESQWQDVLNTARARGWQSAQYGVESWDDLMSGVTAGVVADPGYGLTNAESLLTAKGRRHRSQCADPFL